MIDFNDHPWSVQGGPAFPVHSEEGGISYKGMTLRDYFAAKAIMMLEIQYLADYEIAKRAYAVADAMLAEREKP